jgi:two-component system, OmpR family, phosphate regulon sensor histidine kinase PhoR
MKLDESARIATSVATILALAFVVAQTSAVASVLAVIGGGAMLVALLYRNPQNVTPLLPQAPMVAPITDETNRFQTVLDAVTDPLILLSEARVIRSNSAAQELFGAQFEGQDIRLAIRHPSLAVLLGDTQATGIEEISGLGGSTRIWEVRIAAAGDNLRLIHMDDRSARHAAERARVDFVANASHELRTPLANISGYVETLTDDEAGGDVATRARFLSIIASETKRLSALVEDLMSLSRIEADKNLEPRDIINLSQLIARVVRERRESIIMKIENAECLIRGDAAQLSQLSHNLIDNAIKYGKVGGEVRVKLAKLPNDQINLSVSDQGIGIPSEHIPRLTERFYRVDAGRSHSAGGTGLGLSIVKHIAERHRANLEIKSEIGEGTTVSLTFIGAASHAVT